MTREASGPEEGRSAPVVLDLKALEEQAELLYLHRFVEDVKKARGEYGRFLTLRAGDEFAISAAGDGSADILSQISVERDPAV